LAADGSRSEIILTPANVVHLGLLAPVFSRRLLANKIGKRSATMAAVVKRRMVNTNLRMVEVLLSALDRSGRRLDSVMTERKARLLASKLIEKANELAKSSEPSKQ